jgi:hypothetical protein
MFDCFTAHCKKAWFAWCGKITTEYLLLHLQEGWFAWSPWKNNHGILASALARRLG